MMTGCMMWIPRGYSQATVGTMQLEADANDSYVLFSPMGSETTFIIDKCGRLIHEWNTEGRPGLMAYFMDNGDLIRTRRHQTGLFSGGGIGGIIERLNWEGEVLWRDTLADFTHHHHHDIALMPNGNMLAILWEKWFAEDAIARGQLPELASEEVWVTRIVELAPTPPMGSEVVWSWSPWEHLIQYTDPDLPNYGLPSEHPNRFDINYGAMASTGGPGLGQEAAYDWLHVNSIHFDANRDEIVLSSRNWHEVWIIDHSTTTEEAAGSTGGQHGTGGDLLWRWGNPINYGCGGPEDQRLFGQHDAQFHTLDGQTFITVYSNGNGRPEGDMSTVEHIPLPLNSNGGYIAPQPSQSFLPAQASWVYPQPLEANFFSSNVSGYNLLPNGHRLICEGANGRFFELNNEEEIVWEYVNPINNSGPITQGDTPHQNGVFRATELPLNHPGLAGRDLEPGEPLEINPLELDCTVGLNEEKDEVAFRVWADTHSDQLHVAIAPTATSTNLSFYDLQGRLRWSEPITDETTVDIRFWPAGVYIGILSPSASHANTTSFKILIP